MWLFKRKSDKASHLGTWLKTVDRAYTDAAETMDISSVAEYMTRSLAMRVFETVRHGDKEYQGLSRYCHVSWKKESEDREHVVMLKTVKYDHIKVTRGITAPVGYDYKERWTIEKQASAYILTDIRRI